jgi:hypothetical protein
MRVLVAMLGPLMTSFLASTLLAACASADPSPGPETQAPPLLSNVVGKDPPASHVHAIACAGCHPEAGEDATRKHDEGGGLGDICKIDPTACPTR